MELLCNLMISNKETEPTWNHWAKKYFLDYIYALNDFIGLSFVCVCVHVRVYVSVYDNTHRAGYAITTCV